MDLNVNTNFQPEVPGVFSRRPEDFLDTDTAEKAGVIEARVGPSAPIKFSPDFVWPLSPPLSSLEHDSRKTKPGSLYFALDGLHADGHAFISGALEGGAAAVVHQKELAEYREATLYIKVRDSRFAMSPIAAAFFNHPSRRLGVIGVTGTEGKSTTVYLIYQLLRLLGKKAGFISTVMLGDGKTEQPNSEHQTTPEAITVHRVLDEMYRNGAEYAVIEASSHGLSKKTNRLGDVEFDAAVMTNVTHEHLEFHGSLKQYRSDKAELFRALDFAPPPRGKRLLSGESPVPSFGVINADDPNADYFAAATKRKIWTFSAKGAGADLSVKFLESGSLGNFYEIADISGGETFKIKDNLPGAFNAGNVLAALLTVSRLLPAEMKELVRLVPLLRPARGRMNTLNRGQPFEVLIDYAHTPSSFEAVFPPLRKRLDSTGGKIISLFGSAGERDTVKRALQGKIAARYSDTVILTDEDPRGENPMVILEEIAQGCEADPGREADPGCEGARKLIRGENLFLVPDRPRAIRKAFSLARKGDLVLLLGKGHENSIIYAKETVPYDETTEAEKALEEMGYKDASL